MFVVKYAKLWFGLGIAFMVASVVSMSFFGLRLGPDFTGGVVWEVQVPGEINKDKIEESFLEGEPNPLLVSSTGEDIYRLEFAPFGDLEEEDFFKRIQQRLTESSQEEEQGVDPNEIQLLSSSQISPVVGSELRERSLGAIGLVILAIIGFITYVFRKNSKPVPSVYYGVAAVVALVHDVLIPIGIFAYLSSRGLVTIDLLFIVAILSILGTSINDTIVVFDRVRENVRKHVSKDFAEVIGFSVRQTLMRSINTSLTLVLVLLAIVLFGGATTQYFALALLIGVIFGTYSSIFVAVPTLLFIYQWKYAPEKVKEIKRKESQAKVKKGKK